MEEISVFGVIGIIALAVIGGPIVLSLSLLVNVVLGAGFFGLFWAKERLTYGI